MDKFEAVQHNLQVLAEANAVLEPRLREADALIAATVAGLSKFRHLFVGERLLDVNFKGEHYTLSIEWRPNTQLVALKLDGERLGELDIERKLNLAAFMPSAIAHLIHEVDRLAAKSEEAQYRDVDRALPVGGGAPAEGDSSATKQD